MPNKRNMPTQQVRGKPQTPKASGGIRVVYDELEGTYHIQIYVNKDWETVGRECEERDADNIARVLEAWRKEQ